MPIEVPSEAPARADMKRNQKPRCGRGNCLWLLPLLAAATAAIGQSYTVIDLSANPKVVSPVGRGINDLGQVSGVEGGGFEQPFITINGNVAMLAALHNNYQADAYAINSSGVAAGFSCSRGLICDAVTWDNAGAPIEFAKNFKPVALNDVGDILGITASPVNGNNIGPAVWHHGILKSLPLFSVPPPAQASANAHAINNAGQIVGEASVYTNLNDPVLHGLVWSGSKIQDLGPNTRALGINDRGEVVGQSGTSAALWTNGVLTDLGGLGGSTSVAYEINTDEIVVGYASGEPNDRIYGVVWINGVIHKLDDLTEPKGALASFNYVAATAINSAGQILLEAVSDGNHSLILTPSGISQATSAPTISLLSRMYFSSQAVKIADVTPAAVIHYTLDGTDPTSSSTVYRGPLTISRSSTLKAIAIAAGMNKSVVTSATYTIVAPSSASTAIDLSPVANIQAIGPGNEVYGPSGLDNLGNKYDADLLGSFLTWSGVPFSFLPPTVFNGASNVEVTLPSSRYSSIKLLATATRGNRSHETFIVTYMDGSSAHFVQGMSDWATPQAYPGESAALPMEDRLMGTADVLAFGPYTLYGYTFGLDAKKVVKSLKLPASRNVAILAGVLIGTAADKETCARSLLDDGCASHRLPLRSSEEN